MIYEIIELFSAKYIQATDGKGNVMNIPFDEGNADYQRYLESLDQQ